MFFPIYLIKLHKKWGSIDKTGKVVIALKYFYIRNLSEGFAYVKLDGKKQIIDRTGKYAFPSKYDRVYAFENGMAQARIGGIFTGKT